MQLAPCSECRRHITCESTRCPFCGALQLGAFPRRLLAHAGRLSRAAIFAGTAACASSAPPPQKPPPPPPLDPVIVQQFATAPPPAEGTASVRGFVTLDGRPLTGIRVRAVRRDGGDGDRQHETTTGSKGEYAFVDIEPGQWTLVADHEVPRNRPQDYSPMPENVVVLAAGANQRSDIDFFTPPPPPPDTGPCCKPYGAPPARRRIV